MGQTDSQFKAFILFLRDALDDVKEEEDSAERSFKLDRIIKNLQQILDS